MTTIMTSPVALPGQAQQRLSDSFEYAARPDSVPTARLRTRLILAEWELGELADDTESVLAELLANAVETHQRERLSAPVRVTLLGGLRTILIVVRDASGTAPSPASPEDDARAGAACSSSTRWPPAGTPSLAPSGARSCAHSCAHSGSNHNATTKKGAS